MLCTIHLPKPIRTLEAWLPLNETAITKIADDAVRQILALRGGGVPGVRAVRRDLSGRLKTQSGADVLAMGLRLASAPALKTAHARWVGWELINKHKGALAGLTPEIVEALGAGNSSWDEVDGFGVYIAGPAWLRGLISDADVLDWTGSPDLWRRRAALVTTVGLNSKSHGGKGDVARTLVIAEALIADREDMVIKAMSWALRSLVPWDRQAVETFLERHDRHLAALVKREVRAKLRTGRKTAKRAV